MLRVVTAPKELMRDAEVVVHYNSTYHKAVRVRGAEVEDQAYPW